MRAHRRGRRTCRRERAACGTATRGERDHVDASPGIAGDERRDGRARERAAELVRLPIAPSRRVLARRNIGARYADAVGRRRARPRAAIYTLIETARLNFVDPEAWLRDVLTQIAEGHSARRIAELALWHWKG